MKISMEEGGEENLITDSEHMEKEVCDNEFFNNILGGSIQ